MTSQSSSLDFKSEINTDSSDSEDMMIMKTSDNIEMELKTELIDTLNADSSI